MAGTWAAAANRDAWWSDHGSRDAIQFGMPGAALQARPALVMLHELNDLAGRWPVHLHFPLWIVSGSGYLASALVLTTFCMGSMRPLRLVAVGSNLAFIFYAAVADIRPVLILHSILLPVNVLRLVQIQRAIVTAKRLLGEPDSAASHAGLGEPHFLSRTAVADAGAALKLAEREQERVVRLLVVVLPGEAANTSGIAPAAGAAAARRLLDAIDRFLAALIPSNPTGEQLAQMANLHSRNDVLRALHEALQEMAQLVGQGKAGCPAEVAATICEGLAALLLHADDAAHTRTPDDIELLLRTTEDRSELVERIRQGSIAASMTGRAADYPTVYAATRLYERAVWLLHRYGALLRSQPVVTHDSVGGSAIRSQMALPPHSAAVAGT